ncbi:hypothetical protein STEG23_033063, partial [Scotinomys teguina]
MDTSWFHWTGVILPCNKNEYPLLAVVVHAYDPGTQEVSEFKASLLYEYKPTIQKLVHFTISRVTGVKKDLVYLDPVPEESLDC